MKKRKNAKASPDIETLRTRVERWRRERRKQGPMPEELWNEATRLAQKHGVYAVTRALGLDYGRLKTRVEAAGGRMDGENSDVVEFLEFRPGEPLVQTGTAEATVEVRRADGATLHVRLAGGWTGRHTLDVVAMTEAFVGMGS